MRRLALLALLLAAGGCAASRSGGGPRENDAAQLFNRSRTAVTEGKLSGSYKLQLAAPADSLTLRWTAPRYGALSGCAPDTGLRLRDGQLQKVWELQGQPPWYDAGMMQRPAGMDSVRVWGEPRLVAQLWSMPGQPCSTRVAAGGYFVTSDRSPCWSNIVDTRSR